MSSECSRLSSESDVDSTITSAAEDQQLIYCSKKNNDSSTRSNSAVGSPRQSQAKVAYDSRDFLNEESASPSSLKNISSVGKSFIQRFFFEGVHAKLFGKGNDITDNENSRSESMTEGSHCSEPALVNSDQDTTANNTKNAVTFNLVPENDGKVKNLVEKLDGESSSENDKDVGNDTTDKPANRVSGTSNYSNTSNKRENKLGVI